MTITISADRQKIELKITSALARAAATASIRNPDATDLRTWEFAGFSQHAEIDSYQLGSRALESGVTVNPSGLPPQLNDVHGHECAMRLFENLCQIEDFIQGKFERKFLGSVINRLPDTTDSTP